MMDDAVIPFRAITPDAAEVEMQRWHRNAPSHSDLPHRFYEAPETQLHFETQRNTAGFVDCDVSWRRGPCDYTLLETCP
jgi:hypothetical protein